MSMVDSADRETYHDAVARYAQELYLKRLDPSQRAVAVRTRLSVMDDPNARIFYFQIMVGAWVLMAVASVAVMALPVLVAGAVGTGPRDVVVALAMGLGSFCVAGCAAANWWYYVRRVGRREAGTEVRDVERVLQAGRGAGQSQGEYVAASDRRSRPRNRSLLGPLSEVCIR